MVGDAYGPADRRLAVFVWDNESIIVGGVMSLLTTLGSVLFDRLVFALPFMALTTVFAFLCWRQWRASTPGGTGEGTGLWDDPVLRGIRESPSTGSAVIDQLAAGTPIAGMVTRGELDGSFALVGQQGAGGRYSVSISGGKGDQVLQLAPMDADELRQWEAEAAVKWIPAGRKATKVATVMSAPQPEATSVDRTRGDHVRLWVIAGTIGLVAASFLWPPVRALAFAVSFAVSMDLLVVILTGVGEHGMGPRALRLRRAVAIALLVLCTAMTVFVLVHDL